MSVTRGTTLYSYGGPEHIKKLAFNPNNDQLTFLTTSGKLFCLELFDRSLKATLIADGGVSEYAFSSTGSILAMAIPGQGYIIENLSDQSKRLLLDKHAKPKRLVYVADDSIWSH